MNFKRDLNIPINNLISFRLVFFQLELSGFREVKIFYEKNEEVMQIILEFKFRLSNQKKLWKVKPEVKTEIVIAVVLIL